MEGFLSRMLLPPLNMNVCVFEYIYIYVYMYACRWVDRYSYRYLLSSIFSFKAE